MHVDTGSPPFTHVPRRQASSRVPSSGLFTLFQSMIPGAITSQGAPLRGNQAADYHAPQPDKIVSELRSAVDMFKSNSDGSGHLESEPLQPFRPDRLRGWRIQFVLCRSACHPGKHAGGRDCSPDSNPFWGSRHIILVGLLRYQAPRS